MKLNDKPALVKHLKKRTIYIGNCWIYNGGSKIYDGHTRVNVNKRTIGVHRLSAYIFLDLDLNDSNQQANHKSECKNKTCWNPEHLYVGNHQDNMDDRSSTFIRRTHCKKGHKLTLRANNKWTHCPTCEYEKHKNNLKIRAEKNEQT